MILLNRIYTYGMLPIFAVSLSYLTVWLSVTVFANDPMITVLLITANLLLLIMISKQGLIWHKKLKQRSKIANWQD